MSYQKDDETFDAMGEPVGSDNAFVKTIDAGLDKVSDFVKSGVDKVTDFFGDLKDDTNKDLSHIPPTEVDDDGKIVAGTGTGTGTKASFKDIPKLLLQSILDPVEAAKKNPYWVSYDADDPNSQGGKIAGYYDKTRDANGDGVPDYDSDGNMIDATAYKNKDGTYREVKDSNGKVIAYDKYKPDGTRDNSSNEGTSDFDQMIEEAESQAFATSMEAYLKEHTELQGDALSQEMNKVLTDPEAWLKQSGIKLSDNLPTLDANAEGTTLDPNDPKYQIDTTSKADVQTVTNTSVVDAVTAKNANTYKADVVSDKLTGKEYKVDPVTGEINDKNLVDSDDLMIDMQGSATGVNKDGSINQVGEALNKYASQNISNIIDTTTVSGKLLAQELGEGNYLDAKATMLGQLDILSKQFIDSEGNPKIPTWGQGLARSVSRNIAFTGVSGTAAVASMSTALMESTLPIAEKDSAFFQTLVTTNLSNEQEGIINKAKVLSNFEITNVDAKTKASISNADAFLKMDLTNLDAKNQAEIINTQSRVQGLFEDQKAVNTQRMFTSEQKNEMDRFYENLDSQVQMFVATQLNEMKRFNVSEINDNSEFNETLGNNREQFQTQMQFQIDTAIAEWKRNVILTEFKTKADAAASDVKNLLDVKLEVMNQLWDESDNLLDYIVTLGENEKSREVALAQIAAESSAGGSFLEKMALTGLTAAIKWW